MQASLAAFPSVPQPHGREAVADACSFANTTAADAHSAALERATTTSALAGLGAGQDQAQQNFLYRLFVTSLPKSYTEQDLLPLFNQYGVVRDALILKDRTSGASRGSAFVSYATKQEAERAIKSLDRQLQLPSAPGPLEVRLARSHHYVQPGAGPGDNRQLFFTNAPPSLGESELTLLFSQFGVVEEINLFRERKTAASKGCGFLTMQTRGQALHALEVLGEGSGVGRDAAAPEGAGQASSSGSPADITVQWADPDLQNKKKKALETSNADNRMLFFAKVLRSASEDEVRHLFARFGKVCDVNLFRAFQGAPTSKGCGLITMSTHDEACAAIDGLDSKFTWEGMDSPMAVKWMDAALQRRRREQHLASMRQGMLQQSPPAAQDLWLAQSGVVRQSGTALAQVLAPSPDLELPELPPIGCNPDTIKLFVGNVPKACTEEQLLPFFETVGKVAELVVVRDKATQASKGSAFVWYVQRAHAERAILQFNLRHVLPDPAGEQDRPLVVRKARVRAAPKQLVPSSGTKLASSPVAGLAGAVSQHPAVAMLTGGVGGQPHLLSLGAMGTAGGGINYYTAPQGGGPSGGPAAHALGAGLDKLPSSALTLGPGGMLSFASARASGGGLGAGQAPNHAASATTATYFPLAGASFRAMHPLPAGSTQLVSIQAAPGIGEAGLYDAYASGGGSHAGGGSSAGPSTDRVEGYVMGPAVQPGGGGGVAGHGVTVVVGGGGMLGGGSGGVGGQAGRAGGGGGGGPAPDMLGPSLSAPSHPFVLSLPLNVQQLALVNHHLFNVQSMSGAQVSVTPGGHGLFHLIISGAKHSVDSAHSLLSSVLGQPIL